MHYTLPRALSPVLKKQMCLLNILDHFHLRVCIIMKYCRHILWFSLWIFFFFLVSPSHTWWMSTICLIPSPPGFTDSHSWLTKINCSCLTTIGPSAFHPNGPTQTASWTILRLWFLLFYMVTVLIGQLSMIPECFLILKSLHTPSTLLYNCSQSWEEEDSNCMTFWSRGENTNSFPILIDSFWWIQIYFNHLLFY